MLPTTSYFWWCVTRVGRCLSHPLSRLYPPTSSDGVALYAISFLASLSPGVFVRFDIEGLSRLSHAAVSSSAKGSLVCHARSIPPVSCQPLGVPDPFFIPRSYINLLGKGSVLCVFEGLRESAGWGRIMPSQKKGDNTISGFLSPHQKTASLIYEG